MSTIGARTDAQTTIRDLNNDILDSIISSVDNVDKACLALSSRRFYHLVLATAAPAPLAKVTDLCPRPPWKRLSLSDYENDYSQLMRRLVLYLTRKQMRAGLLSRRHFPCTCAWEEIYDRQVLVCSHCTSHKMSPYEFKYDFDRNYYDLVRDAKKKKWRAFGKRVVEKIYLKNMLVAVDLLITWGLVFCLVGYVGEMLGFW